MHTRIHAGRGIGSHHRALVLHARLMDDIKLALGRLTPTTELLVHLHERLAHQQVDHVRALTATCHEDRESIGRDIGETDALRDAVADRQTRPNRLDARQVLCRDVKADRHRLRITRKELDRAPRHRVGLVQHHGNPALLRRQHRRKRRIAPHRQQGIRLRLLHLPTATADRTPDGEKIPKRQLLGTGRENRTVPGPHDTGLDITSRIPDRHLVSAPAQLFRHRQTRKRMSTRPSASNDYLHCLIV